MAVDRVNLLPKAMQPKRQLNFGTLLATAWVMGLVLMALVSVARSKELSAKESKYQELSSLARSLNADLERLSVEAGPGSDLQLRLATARKIVESRVSWTEAFKELSLLIPSKVWLTNLTSRRPEGKPPVLELVGEAPSQPEMAAFLASLENSFHFRKTVMRKSERLSGFSPDLFRFGFESELLELSPRRSDAKSK